MTAHHKFELKGEHGHGKHVLVFSCGGDKDLVFKNLVSKDWKFQYFNIDIHEDVKSLEQKFTETLHYYHYAKYLILDFPAFLVISCHLQKVLSGIHNFEKIIIFNPVKFKKSFYDFLFPSFLKNRYICLNGDVINISDKYIDKRPLCEDKLHLLKASEVIVLGIQDRIEAFWLSSKIKNSHFVDVESYNIALEYIAHNI